MGFFFRLAVSESPVNEMAGQQAFGNNLTRARCPVLHYVRGVGPRTHESSRGA